MYRAVKCFLGVAAFTLLSTSAFAQGTLQVLFAMRPVLCCQV